MAMPSSGVLKWSAIQTEFGGTNPVKLSEYYGQSTLPTSGLIKASDFYGTSSTIVYNQNTQNFTAPGDGTARLHRDTALQSLLSGVSASSITVTKATWHATGFFEACRDDQNQSSGSVRYFYFNEDQTNYDFFFQQGIPTAPFNSCYSDTNNAVEDLMIRLTTAELQEFVKNGCPITSSGVNPLQDGVNHWPPMSAMYIDLEFTATT